jgi:hypothetical protein
MTAGSCATAVAAALVVITLVIDDGDRVIAGRPEAGAGDRGNQLAEVGVAKRHQVLILRVERIAGVEAVRRITVLVMAFVGDDVAESRPGRAG